MMQINLENLVPISEANQNCSYGRQQGDCSDSKK